MNVGRPKSVIFEVAPGWDFPLLVVKIENGVESFIAFEKGESMLLCLYVYWEGTNKSKRRKG